MLSYKNIKHSPKKKDVTKSAMKYLIKNSVKDKDVALSNINLSNTEKLNFFELIMRRYRRFKSSSLSRKSLRSDAASDPNLEEPADNFEDNRGHWGKQLDFLLSCIGFAVGLGNIWRFPFKVLSNGGASFLIAYVIMLVVMALPLFLIELSIGQFTSRGVSECWHFLPGFKGIGYIMLLMSLFCSLYYNTVIAWTFYYAFNSFTPTLPWLTCNNVWNDYLCMSSNFKGVANISANTTVEMSTEQFFERVVINSVKTVPGGEPVARQISDNPETLVWYTTLCLVLSWLMCAFILMYGIKVSGKVMYFMTTYPYLVLTVIIICGATLTGSRQGMIFYFYPEVKNLITIKIWRDAAEQIFFSLGVGFGSMLTFGSYNKFHANLQRDLILIGCINSGTSLYGGVAVFEILGFMAYRYNTTVSDMSKYAGSGLIFMAYPEGFSQFSGQNVLCFLFFTMILCLGIDSQLGMMETVITGLIDEFPYFRETSRNRVFFVLGLNAFCCVFALIFVTKTGYLWFIVMSYYSVATNLLMVGFFESVSVAYIYGINNFSRDFKMMIGTELSRFWKFCLLIPVPIITLFLTIYAMVTSTRTVIGSGYKEIVFPLWADILGWMIFVISLLPFPIFFIYYVIIQIAQEKQSFLNSLKSALSPDMYYGPSQTKYWRKNSFYNAKYNKFKTDKSFLKLLESVNSGTPADIIVDNVNPDLPNQETNATSEVPSAQFQVGNDSDSSSAA